MESELILALHTVPDDELLRRLSKLVGQSRHIEADLVAHIGEVDERRLYARQAFPSMFSYCTQVLRLSEAEAYRRITVARAARKHPVLLAMLRDGRLHLSGMATLVPLLTAENCETLLERATHLTKREIEELIAELSPRPDVPAGMRKLPQERQAASTGDFAGEGEGFLSAVELVPGTVGAKAATAKVGPPPPTPAAPPAALTHSPSAPAVVESLSPGRYKVQFTASAELHDKIERLVALMRSEVPSGDLAEIIDRAVTEKLDRLEARRFARTTAPRKTLADTDTDTTSRYIPATVRRAVRERDGNRCCFVDEQGRRCSERHRLEFHHRYPFGMGGDHSPANISLVCFQHNRALAEHDYGQTAVRRHRAREKNPLVPQALQRTARTTAGPHTPRGLA